MRISIFGLGYVGAVSCGCFAKDGYNVIGVDISQTKVNLINQGQSPIIEDEIGEIIKQVVEEGKLRAIQDAQEAILNTDISLICVGTPSKPNGSLDLTYVERACEHSGQALKKKNDYHIIVGRSTILPGTTKNLIIPTLEKHSGKKVGADLGVCFNPEFMREGTSVYDFYNPPKTVIGADDEKSANIVKELYKDLPAEIIITSIEVSEMVKYVDNNFHAMKITFANEIGTICKKLNIDSHKVMEIFCKDTKLNISPYYFNPGFAFGGSCLPKDIRALCYKSKSMDLETPLLNSLMESNRKQINRVVNQIVRIKKKKIGVLGFSFKAGTDDLRESPIVEVIETLLGKGYSIKLYDRNVNIARLIGANKKFIEEHIPHIAQLMCENMNEVVNHAEVLIIGNNADEFKDVLDKIGEDKIIIDLVRIDKNKNSEGNYYGIAW